MLVSASKKFLFVHVPKAAGTSITAALEGYCRPSPLRRALDRIGLWKIPRPHPHSSAAKLREFFPKELFDSSFKFAFVRNPWDWHVSLYQYILETPHHHQHAVVKTFSSFETYLDWRCSESLLTQLSYIADEEDRLLVEFVGRFENVERDFETICRRIGVQATLPHLNVSRHAPYRSVYSDRMKRRVEEAYAKDIQLFGYEF